MICKLLLVYCLAVCQAMQQHLVCQSMGAVIRPSPLTVSGRSSYVGNRGLIGPRGREGKTGAPGPPGIVDYGRVNSTIDEKIQTVSSDLDNLQKTSEAKIQLLGSKMKRVTSELDNLEKTCDVKIEKLRSEMKTATEGFSKLESSLEAKMQNLKAELISRMEHLLSSTKAPSLAPSTTASNLLLLRKQQGLCDVQYKNFCFWAIVHNNRDVNYTEAERLCKKSGGQVADIHDKMHYGLVVKYLRTKIPSSRSYNSIWIGTKYNPIIPVATARNGGQAFESWFPGQPDSGSSYSSQTAVYIDVDRDEDNKYQGMLNGDPEWRIDGAVCEI